MSTSNRVNEIDLLRFIAALSVLVFHYAFRGHAADDMTRLSMPALAPLAAYGYLGVELFFLISGFVILMTVQGVSLGAFIASRVGRLYPAFWICCTLTFLVTLLFGAPRFSASFGQYLANMTMLSGFVGVRPIDGVYWSLFVELQFYALIALLLLGGQMRHVERWLLGWLALVVLGRWVPLGKLGVLLLDGYAPLFAAGALCFLIHQQGLRPARLLGVVVALLLSVDHALQQASGYSAHFKRVLEPAIVALLISSWVALMLAVALGLTGWFARRRWLVLGALTYPLYLIHQQVGYIMFNALPATINPYVQFLAVSALMLGAAYAVHRLVERPLGPTLRQRVDALLGKCSFGPIRRAINRV